MGLEAGSSYAQANREYFNKLVSSPSYQPPKSAQELAKRAAHAILRNYEFDEDSTEVLDFACGSGLLSQHLSPHCKSIVGVDISQGMVDLYNATALNQGLLPEEVRAICTDILSPDYNMDGKLFDVAVCASAYHHLESIDDVTAALASHLKPSGSLIVVDLIKPDDPADLDELFPEHGGIVVAHRGGFDEGTIVQAFQKAGLVAIDFRAAINVKKKGKSLQLFLAKGRRLEMPGAS